MTRRSRGKHGALPIVFVGPSLSPADGAEILPADYRPPIRRGDLDLVPDGAVVAIIDGVFDQDLSVSPSEIRNALARGVRVFGAASMGALRAVEVPGVVGVGRVYELYRRGTIDSDDEVAVAFDPETGRALSIPLVNVRYALERLAAPGTISHDLATALLRAARKLPYWERLYPRIVAEAGFAARAEAAQLAKMLGGYDLKRDDAVTLLEHLRGLRLGRTRSGASSKDARTTVAPAPLDSIHLWEFGPPLPFREVVGFLACTGELQAVALAASRGIVVTDLAGTPPVEAIRARLLTRTARAWSWMTEEEVDVSLADLGIDQAALAVRLDAEVDAECRAMALVRAGDPAFLEALRLHLFLEDLALKRAGARAASLRVLAERGRAVSGAPTAAERAAAVDALCRSLDVRDERLAREYLGWWGVDRSEVDAYLDRLACARRMRGPLVRATRAGRRRALLLVEARCPKAPGSRRFCVPLDHASAITRRLSRVVGVTRVAMITHLGALGIPNAQAFRPDGEWSSTVGSGKSTTAVGARIGAVMEEVEKWAQEKYRRGRAPSCETTASYTELRARTPDLIDPATLDLPYDSCYRPDLVITWHRCADLITGRSSWVPAAAIMHGRVADDIYFSPHGGRKTVTTNGLASGLTMAEALTHALCEIIERHARTTAAVVVGNPGVPSPPARAILDLDTVPPSTRRLVRKICHAGHRVRVWELTADVRVPTFAATIFIADPLATGPLYGDNWRRASGWACHPDPATAVEMAILEASQTVMTHIAGAREDLTLTARSLGRHERTDAIRRAAYLADLDLDAPVVPFAAIVGFTSSDAADDVRWIIERLRDAGCEHAVIADYSVAAIRPARVVRAVIPGLDTINPFHTGRTPRLALLHDLL